ncbi:cytochrome c [Pedobacter sp. UYP30]|uniref:c-type cytochrome n=1 Tax=Pedobacter sp. UYP30 TaxID=1756400 RepID=UPI00339708E6
MKKTILTLGAAIILMGSYCTSSRTPEQSTDSVTKVDNVVTSQPTEQVKPDTQKVNLEKPSMEAASATQPDAKPEQAAVKKENTEAGTPAQITAGGKLLAKSDCLACHNEQTKIVGPAYVDVAKKYAPTAANIDHLVAKIISGGAGVWGEVPMSPHPSLAKADAKLMVQYILSLKK